ncbi:MAG: Gfo/Idh/MocA family oxidoreductase [Roseivirga sp.]
MTHSRRGFIKKSSLLTVGLTTLPAFLSASQLAAAHDTVNMAVIGCNGMGWSNMRSHLQMANVRCIALCDVDDSVLARRTEEYKEYRDNSITTYKDYRKLLENKDIDAVVIGTPDHWHCKMMVDALEAGKHVYVEKPLANSVQECYLMEKAATKYNKQVVQVGQWQRSGTHYAKAIDIVRSGQLGNIRLVKVWAYQGWMKPVPVKPDGAVPQGVDYDMWLGPAKKRAFNANRFHFNFRWFWDYAGGLMTDWGVHEIDIALYAMQASAPKSVMASGGKLAYPDDASETPDTLQAVFEYDNFNMLWEHATGIDNGNYGRTEGIAFIGNNGTLVLNRGGFEVIVEDERVDGQRKTLMDEIPPEKTQGSYLNLHTSNFIEAIQKNDPTAANCPPSTGSVAAINAHMGNVAYKTGRKVYWDTEKQNFGQDSEANALIGAQYHNGWKMPVL